MVRRVTHAQHFDGEPDLADINKFIAEKLKVMAGDEPTVDLTKWTLRIHRPGTGLVVPTYEMMWTVELFRDYPE